MLWVSTTRTCFIHHIIINNMSTMIVKTHLSLSTSCKYFLLSYMLVMLEISFVYWAATFHQQQALDNNILSGLQLVTVITRTFTMALMGVYILAKMTHHHHLQSLESIRE